MLTVKGEAVNPISSSQQEICFHPAILSGNGCNYHWSNENDRGMYRLGV